MSSPLYLAFFVLLAKEGFAAPPVAEALYRTPGQDLDLFLEFFFELVFPVLYNSSGEDPASFKDFTYDLDGILQAGEANMTNSQIVGMSNFERHLTYSLEREEIGIRLYYPEVTFTGHYSLSRDDGGCSIFGCYFNFHDGLGDYSHTFTGVTLEGIYKLDDSTNFDPSFPSIRYTPVKFDVMIENCSLYAENYTYDGVLQTDWERRSQLWMDNYVKDETQQRINNILFGEGTALVFTYVARMNGRSAQYIIDEFLGLGADIIP